MPPFEIEFGDLGERLQIGIAEKKTFWRRRPYKEVKVTDLDSGETYTFDTDEPFELEWTNTQEKES